MASVFQFSADRHLYQHDGQIVPSVTQVLALAAITDVSGIPLYYLERAAAIGTAVHQACEFLDQDDLELDSLDESIVGYVLGYQRFREEHEFVPEAIERRGVATSCGLRFGYCVDRIGTMDGKRVLLDIKTSSKRQPSWAIQTAAYADAEQHEGERLVVHVAKDGTYKLIRYDQDADFSIWLAALHVAHWRLANGAKLKELR